MRILHTSDWHLGRTLEGRDRLAEQSGFMEELCQIAEDENIHLVMITGDVFDTVNPPAAAEELFYNGLERLSAGGKRAVTVIAGNHDNPERLCAAAPLASRHSISLLGRPGHRLNAEEASLRRAWRVAAGNSWLELEVPGCHHRALVLALPYPSESRLRELLTSSLEEAAIREAHSHQVERFFCDLSAHFRADTIRLVMSHLYMVGGIESDSERPIQLGGACAVWAAALPAAAQYIGLGHLHRPQEVRGTPSLTRYAGSPLAYSFSEAGQTKSVVVVEADPQKVIKSQEIYLSSGRPLVKWQAKEGLVQAISWCEEGRDAKAWIDLELHLVSPLSMDEIQRLRRMHPGIVHIRPCFPEQEQLFELERRSGLSLDELFRRFYTRQRGGGEPAAELVRLFMDLVQGNCEEGEAAGQ